MGNQMSPHSHTSQANLGCAGGALFIGDRISADNDFKYVVYDLGFQGRGYSCRGTPLVPSMMKTLLLSMLDTCDSTPRIVFFLCPS